MHKLSMKTATDSDGSCKYFIDGASSFNGDIVSSGATDGTGTVVDNDKFR